MTTESPRHAKNSPPVVVEIERKPALPTLKRRRLPSGEATEPLIREATEKESAKKRRALGEPDRVEEIDMGDAPQRRGQIPSGDATKPLINKTNAEKSSQKDDARRNAANATDERVDDARKKVMSDSKTFAAMHADTANTDTREIFWRSSGSETEKAARSK